MQAVGRNFRKLAECGIGLQQSAMNIEKNGGQPQPCAELIKHLDNGTGVCIGCIIKGKDEKFVHYTEQPHLRNKLHVDSAGATPSTDLGSCLPGRTASKYL